MGTRLERRLAQHLAREKASNRAKDEFLAALSHELRIPLNPALLLASDGAGNQDLPAEIRRDFNTICDNIEIEARLIDDLLDLTRISRGKLALKRSAVDVHAVLQSAVAKVDNEMAKKQIFLRMHFRAMHHHVDADPVRLQQVFWNILRNAIKFTLHGGRICLETETMDKQIAITITDSGIGMTPDEIKSIFKQFSQGAHSLGGLGLGLAISRKLVELHNGSIQATSLGKGKGATFSIKFPVARISDELKKINHPHGSQIPERQSMQPGESV
ncbi:MAG TPA: HAMP domain-containing sensor histidine kinase [Candidatus Sulfotelmatobacter sp.]|nr:HAMP domain-containing sensor histidine kinase [Candidatus Sulfotelmatobacter sp.]